MQILGQVAALLAGWMVLAIAGALWAIASAANVCTLGIWGCFHLALRGVNACFDFAGRR